MARCRSTSGSSSCASRARSRYSGGRGGGTPGGAASWRGCAADRVATVKPRLLAPALALALAFGIAPAASAQTYSPVRGYDGPGPSQYDRTHVLKFGPSSAKRVLILVPGTYAGA